ncbi:hypothetical protein AMS59_10050 [Lysinibacillus sp. FJAT-14745]|uniref:hypothetical protein n=1 Tax=Lysinibacillus sp. FJAT-14745 TaxID=1704289 RepID=UPI0006ABB4BF|nr:hypothetical protein [Lysinibacillus sp. FJAT-14745]KOP79351.1 hypothetical protein AMS59_10050 [Lysinibacillus sp. FJAT-14745]
MTLQKQSEAIVEEASLFLLNKRVALVYKETAIAVSLYYLNETKWAETHIVSLSAIYYSV